MLLGREDIKGNVLGRISDLIFVPLFSICSEIPSLNSSFSNNNICL